MSVTSPVFTLTTPSSWLSTTSTSTPTPTITVAPLESSVFDVYPPPCKCDSSNQIRYYNRREKKFYYHTAIKVKKEKDKGDNEEFEVFFDPYEPVVGKENQRHLSGQRKNAYNASGACELFLVALALLLWLYSFYRLYLVWQNTLNFSEASIQGPQGWDILVNWIWERMRIKRLRVPKSKANRRRKRAACIDGDPELGDDDCHDDDHDDDQDDVEALNDADSEQEEARAVEHQMTAVHSTTSVKVEQRCHDDHQPKESEAFEVDVGKMVTRRDMEDFLRTQNERDQGLDERQTTHNEHIGLQQHEECEHHLVI